MKTILLSIILLASTFAFAGKTYQVTGTVVEITDSKIIVDKKGEKFEIEKTAQAKITGDVKKGGKVTVYYSMTTSEIEAKK